MLEKRDKDYPFALQSDLCPYYDWVPLDDSANPKVRREKSRWPEEFSIQYPYLTRDETGILNRVADRAYFSNHRTEDNKPKLKRENQILKRIEWEIEYWLKGGPLKIPPEGLNNNEQNWLNSIWSATAVKWQVSYRYSISRPYSVPLAPVTVFTTFQKCTAFAYMFEQCMAWRNDCRDPNMAGKPSLASRPDLARYHGAVHTVEEWAKIHTRVKEPNSLPSYLDCNPQPVRRPSPTRQIAPESPRYTDDPEDDADQGTSRQMRP
ncbi:hypothetical protein MMC25_008025 [Agyrium rufum]|nr:hypothetical protein [Agyrium rufum]